MTVNPVNHCSTSNQEHPSTCKDRENLDLESQDLRTCPNCNTKFALKDLAAFYGLYASGDDDVVLLGLCHSCKHVVEAHPDLLERQRLKEKLESRLLTKDSGRLRSFAITTLKILEVHGGDHIQALKLGWPFPKAMHHYHVSCMPGGMVVVCEKEAGHE